MCVFFLAKFLAKHFSFPTLCPTLPPTPLTTPPAPSQTVNGRNTILFYSAENFFLDTARAMQIITEKVLQYKFERKRSYDTIKKDNSDRFVFIFLISHFIWLLRQIFCRISKEKESVQK